MSDQELLHLELSIDNVVLFDFNGVMTQNSVVTIAKTVENKLIKAVEDESRVRSIFEIIVEMMQNILSYSADSINLGNNMFESRGSLFISFQTRDKHYNIHSGNYVYKQKQEGLKKNLDEVNAIALDEIKNVYKERRRERRRVHSRGAGLGFLDMVRKSKNRLEYSFKDTDEDDKVYFELYVKV